MRIWLTCFTFGIVEACTLGTFGDWTQWSTCSESCAGGTQKRHGKSCFWKIPKTETRNCNEFCVHGHYYRRDVCSCPSWRSGRCCETCKQIYIEHCVLTFQQCSGSPDGIKCTLCENPTFRVAITKDVSAVHKLHTAQIDIVQRHIIPSVISVNTMVFCLNRRKIKQDVNVIFLSFETLVTIVSIEGTILLVFVLCSYLF